VVQGAFARAAVRWSRLRDYEAPEAWVRRVAMNLAAERARRLRRLARALQRIGRPPEVPEISVEGIALLEALRTLPVRQRQAIVLHYLVGLPVEEVAQTLSARSGTVKSLLFRGRRALADRLGAPEEVLIPMTGLPDRLQELADFAERAGQSAGAAAAARRGRRRQRRLATAGVSLLVGVLAFGVVLTDRLPGRIGRPAGGRARRPSSRPGFPWPLPAMPSGSIAGTPASWST
jgi:RNA polymerase sigma-70 factor, ECF subfamily